MRSVPVTERFRRIMAIFAHKSEAVEKYREELLGSATEFSYSDTYHYLMLGKELFGSFLTFQMLLEDPRKLRMIAKLIAQQQLHNMVEVVQRHDMLQRQKIEKLQQKANKKK